MSDRAQFPKVRTVRVCGLDLAAMSFDETIVHVEQLIEARQPAYFITANVNYAMLAEQDRRLAGVNARAAFVVADGMPLVWAARWQGRPLPGRVTGSDLTPALCRLAARRGYPIFLLGGAPGVGLLAAEKLSAQFPGLVVAGVESPNLDELGEVEMEALAARIRDSGARLLFAALGQPKGEIWLAEHFERLGRAVGVQIGATIDFAAGRVRRAPPWMQRSGLEWLYRLIVEPKRLTRRYSANAWFLLRRFVFPRRAE